MTCTKMAVASSEYLTSVREEIKRRYTHYCSMYDKCMEICKTNFFTEYNDDIDGNLSSARNVMWHACGLREALTVFDDKKDANQIQDELTAKLQSYINKYTEAKTAIDKYADFGNFRMAYMYIAGYRKYIHLANGVEDAIEAFEVVT